MDTVDPLAGSFYVERLTEEIEKEAERLIHKIDEMGGAVSAIEEGFYQDSIGQSAYRAQLAVEAGESVVVGVNKYESEKPEAPIETMKVSDAIRQQQSERLADLRSRRDEAMWSAAMDAIESAARTDKNLMPHILKAVESFATVGEIAHRLRGVWGEHAG